MKKIIVVCLLLGLMALLVYPNIGSSKSPKVANSQPDEIQYDYMSRLLAIQREIGKRQYELNIANIDAAHYRSAKIERAVKEAEREFENLDKDIRLLRTEIIQYYKGKIPKDLRAMIADTVKVYDDAKMEAYKPQ